MKNSEKGHGLVSETTGSYIPTAPGRDQRRRQHELVANCLCTFQIGVPKEWRTLRVNLGTDQTTRHRTRFDPSLESGHLGDQKGDVDGR